MDCRWETAASEIAEEVRFEREAAAQLAQPGSLSSADEAYGLVRELLQRAAASYGVPCSQQLLQRVIERCADRGESPLHTFVSTCIRCPNVLVELQLDVGFVLYFNNGMLSLMCFNRLLGCSARTCTEAGAGCF